MHYGVTGQKWGLRRYQNADGSLTPEGRLHYHLGEGTTKDLANQVDDMFYRKNGKIKTFRANGLADVKRQYKQQIKDEIENDLGIDNESELEKFSDKWNKKNSHLIGEEADAKFIDEWNNSKNNKHRDQIARNNANAEIAKAEVDKMADEIFGSDEMIKKARRGANAVYISLAAIGTLGVLGASTAYVLVDR